MDINTTKMQSHQITRRNKVKRGMEHILYFHGKLTQKVLNLTTIHEEKKKNKTMGYVFCFHITYIIFSMNL